jgi:hypothetical protein
MRVYRPARPVVWAVGLLAVLFAFLLALVTVIFTLAELKPGDEWEAQLFILVVVGALATVSTGLWIYLLSQRIVIHGLWITFVGVFRKRSIHLRDVTRVLWRNNDSVTLIVGRCGQRYSFGAYSVEDAADLIKLIRNNVPAARHEGWHPFYQARMKGRLDRQQRFLLQNPRANPNPQPIKVGRLLTMSLATSFPIALGFWGLIQWHLRQLDEIPPAPITGTWLFDCLVSAAAANAVPLLLTFVELLRQRRQRRAWETTGIEFV